MTRLTVTYTSGVKLSFDYKFTHYRYEDNMLYINEFPFIHPMYGFSMPVKGTLDLEAL